MNLATIKHSFAGAVASLADLDSSSFEILGRDFPLRTHVMVTPYYLQLGTMLKAHRLGLRGRSRSRFYRYLSEMNSSTSITKVTAEADATDEEGCWLLMARAMIVSGQEGTNYSSAAIGNILTLWHQDVANLITTEGAYEVGGMVEG